MSEFFDKTGVMALGSRIRMLSEKVTKDAQKICSMYNVDIKAKWYPVVFCLLDNEKYKTVTQIANEIGHSHVSIVKIIKEMSAEGLLIEIKDENDKRKTNITLSKEGRKKVKGLEYQHIDTTIAIQEMMSQMQNNFWTSMNEFEKLFDEKGTYQRVLEEKKKRENSYIKTVEYEDKYKKDFKKLNEDWIKKYFKIEEKDIKILSQPRENIIDNGGFIIIALYKDEVAGVCSLQKSEEKEYDYELAKMAVDDKFKGKGIGYILGKAIVDKAKEQGAKSIFLESNTILVPAINLYKKLGFKEVVRCSSVYNRCNIQMELFLKD